MKEIPLIFTDQMVSALLEDRKTQTQRLYGRLLQPGDRIWVRETHMIGMQRTTDAPSRQCPTDSALWAYYAASKHPPAMARLSSTHMPRWASRIVLEVTAPSRMERLHDITEEDAQAEGLPRNWDDSPGWVGEHHGWLTTDG
jgi:hypothetical protein